MQQIADRQTEEFHKSFIGQKLDVLFETTEAAGIVSGLTGNYIRVYTDTIQDSFGQIRSVKLERLYQDGLWGISV